MISAPPPRAALPRYQHVIDTYSSETNKTASAWCAFDNGDLDWRPHERSMSVREIMRHHLLSERLFFADFLSSDEPAVPDTFRPDADVPGFAARLIELAQPRLAFLAARDEEWWLTGVRFFDVERERIWIFWRRVLHSAHHRTQLTVYLRLLDKPVVSIYGPTADLSSEAR